MIKHNNTGLGLFVHNHTGWKTELPRTFELYNDESAQKHYWPKKPPQQRPVDRILMTWTTRQESLLLQTESQNKDRRQWSSLCTQVVLMEVRGSHGRCRVTADWGQEWTMTCVSFLHFRTSILVSCLYVCVKVWMMNCSRMTTNFPIVQFCLHPIQ